MELLVSRADFFLFLQTELNKEEAEDVKLLRVCCRLMQIYLDSRDALDVSAFVRHAGQIHSTFLWFDSFEVNMLNAEHNQKTAGLFAGRAGRNVPHGLADVLLGLPTVNITSPHRLKPSELKDGNSFWVWNQNDFLQMSVPACIIPSAGFILCTPSLSSNALTFHATTLNTSEKELQLWMPLFLSSQGQQDKVIIKAVSLSKHRQLLHMLILRDTKMWQTGTIDDVKLLKWELKRGLSSERATQDVRTSINFLFRRIALLGVSLRSCFHFIKHRIKLLHQR